MRPTAESRVAEDDKDASRGPLADVIGSGTAADGAITVVASVDGRRDAVTFDPRVMRLPSETLAGFVRDAMRDAHKALFAQLAEREASSADDLTKRVEEMQAAYTARMQSYERLLTDIEVQLRNGDR
jgi:DNA-binding protein YbaB